MKNKQIHIHALTAKKPEKATLQKRFYAFAMDLIVIVMITFSLVLSYLSFIKTFMLGLNIDIENRLLALDSVIFMGVFWTYHFLSLYLGEGATPGKFAMGLRIHSPHKKNTHLSFKESFYRTSGYFFCYFTGAFLLGIPYFTRSRRGIPDWISKTHVISVSEFNHLKSLEAKPIVYKEKVLLFPEDPTAKKLAQENIKKIA